MFVLTHTVLRGLRIGRFNLLFVVMEDVGLEHVPICFKLSCTGIGGNPGHISSITFLWFLCFDWHKKYQICADKRLEIIKCICWIYAGERFLEA